MEKNQRSLLITLTVLLCGLLAYTAARAALLSMTHDESTTFNWFQHTNVFSCFHSEDCWVNANNHLLNTWGWQQSVRLFGISEFAIRTPNLLAHLLYLLCTLALAWKTSRQFWLTLAGFALLNINPYLLDFFSLARGYGLYVGICMSSVYLLFIYLENQRPATLLGSYLLAALAVMANFVALNYLLSLWATVFFMSLFRPFKDSAKPAFQWREQLRTNLIPLSISLILAVLLYRPIQFLQGGGEFTFGAERFAQSFQSLVQDSLYSVNYFGKNTLWIFGLLYALAIFAALFDAFRLLLPAGNRFALADAPVWRRQYLAAAFLFIGSCLIMIAQHYILGSNYLQNRKALLFIPLSALLFFFLLHSLQQAFSDNRFNIALAFIALFIVYHFFRTANFQYTREWWYDQNTREMVEYMDARIPPARDSVQLGVNWVFQPSTLFYLQTKQIEAIIPPAIGGEIHADGRYDFYYVFDGDIPRLEEKYVVEKRFKWGRSLLRRRDLEW